MPASVQITWRCEMICSWSRAPRVGTSKRREYGHICSSSRTNFIPLLISIYDYINRFCPLDATAYSVNTHICGSWNVQKHAYKWYMWNFPLRYSKHLIWFVRRTHSWMNPHTLLPWQINLKILKSFALNPCLAKAITCKLPYIILYIEMWFKVQRWKELSVKAQGHWCLHTH